MAKRAEFDEAMSEYIKRKVSLLCVMFVVNYLNLISEVMPVIVNCVCRKVARVRKLKMMKIMISDKHVSIG